MLKNLCQNFGRCRACRSIQSLHADVTRSINHLAVRVINSLDEVALPAHPAVGEDGVGQRYFLRRRAEIADVALWILRYLGKSRLNSEFGDVFDARTISHAHGHRVA